jgi:hypothetical protein
LDHRRDPTFPEAFRSCFNGSLFSADEPPECLRSSVYSRDGDQSSPQDRSGYSLSESFHTKVNQSVAEDTIQHYIVKYWSCNQTGHSYASKQDQITWPNKDKPGVQEKAKKARKDFNDCQRKMKKISKRGSKRNANMLLSEALGSMTGDKIKALIASGSPSKKAKDSQVTTFMVAFEVSQVPGAKPLLPISIKPNLPHIVMPIGQEKEALTFSLLLAYDTCAACNVRYLGHRLPIAENSRSWLRASSTRPRNTLLFPYQALSLTRKVASLK